ncbi:MAG TPA: hypothetical protein PKD86_16125 [Gemmatales bacterium]|nr:hypothetical protein [Gemmatales bacterium]HMP60873.1 hypothetical protein [Gemmatales bacterium]
MANEANAATSPSAGTPLPHPLRRDIRTPGTWRYLVNYVLLGSALVLMVGEMIESGDWRKLSVPAVLVFMAVGNLATLGAAEQRQLPSGGVGAA